jgi:hypothetical protein
MKPRSAPTESDAEATRENAVSIAAAIAALGVSAISACLPGAVPVSLDLQKDDVVIVVTLQGGLAQAPSEVTHFVHGGGGAGFVFAHPPNTPFIVYRLKGSDLVRPDGPVLPEDLQSLRVRLTSSPLDIRPDPKRGGTGYCGRCLVPSIEPPQIVNDGDSCALPTYAEGQAFYPSPGGFAVRNDAMTPTLLENVRGTIRLDWPGACACAPTPPKPSLEGIDIRPVSPVTAPWTFGIVAERPSDGIIAAFGEQVAATFPSGQSPQIVTPIPELNRAAQAAISIRSGPYAGDFLVAAEIFDQHVFEPSTFLRFHVGADGAVQGPFAEGDVTESLSSFRYLKDGDDPAQPYPAYPLYGLGARETFGAFTAGMVACDEQMFTCREVPVPECPPAASLSDMHAAFVASDDSGVAIADTALYYKQASPSRTIGPTPSDPWICTPLRSYRWATGVGSATASVDIAVLRAMGRIKDRFFICGIEAVPDCMPPHAIVLSATVGAAPGEFPSPDWRVVYQSSEKVRCKDFVPFPGDTEKIRLVLNSGDMVDFDQNAHATQSGNLFSLFPDRTGWWSVGGLQGGSTLVHTFENGLLLKRASAAPTDKFQRIYGEPRHGAAYGAMVENECGFLAFGDPNGLVQYVTPAKAALTPGLMPGVRPPIPWDAAHGLSANEGFMAAVRDTESSAGGLDVALAVGYNNASGTNRPIARRIYLSVDPSTCEGQLEDANEIELGPELDGIAFLGIAETGRGSFVVIAEGTRLFQITGTTVTEIQTHIELMNPPDACTHEVPRLDAWSAIGGQNGVAWAVGARDLIMRIAGGHADAYKATTLDPSGMPVEVDATWSSVAVTCPDRVMIGGQVEVDLLGPIASVFEAVHQGTPEGQCRAVDVVDARSKTDPIHDPLIVREYPQSCSGLPGPIQIRFARPVGFIEDGASLAVAMDSGYLFRFSAERLERITVPFGVLTTLQDSSGTVIFGSTETRLAVGVPTATVAR